MPFHPPLTLDQLKAIQERNLGNPDVMTLLWEAKRLRAMLATAYEVREHFPKPLTCLAEVWQEFQDGLANEPAVTEGSSGCMPSRKPG
jgi:hypothetical protein